MEKIRKIKKIIGFFAVIITIIIVVFIVIGIVITWQFRREGILGNPKEIMARYQEGLSIDKITQQYPEYYKEIKGPYDINKISIGGWDSPKRPLYDGETLLIYFDGEYMIFLYFNKNGTLFHKEITGS